jgi:hypothetical protein
MRRRSLLAGTGVLAVLVALLRPGAAQQGHEPEPEDEGVVAYSASLKSEAEDRVFTSDFGHDQLDTTPSWSADQPNPPLSARKAIEHSNRKLQVLLKQPKRWQLHTLTLTHAYGQKWYWVVSYHKRVEPKSGLPPPFQVIVLMDGKVIHPKVTEK